MADETKRVIDQTTDTSLSAGDFIIIDSQSEGTRKFDLGTELTSVKSDLLDLRGGVPVEVRKSIYTLLTSALYSDTGLTDEKIVVKSWADEVTSITINQSSVSISGANTVQLVATTSPPGGTIMWQSSDPSVASVNSYGLVTGVNNGTAIITASCGDISASCEVSVSGFAVLTSIEATYTQSGAVYENDTLDSLKEDLVVVAYYDDSSSREIQNYALSGTLEVGTSTILVEFGGKTDTFDVEVDYDVPEGYTRYDYIKNAVANKNAAVFTGLNYVYGGSNYEHRLEFAFDGGTETNGTGLFGLRKQAGTNDNSITIWQVYDSASSKGKIVPTVRGLNYANGVLVPIGQKNIFIITYENGTNKTYFNDALILNAVPGGFEVSSTIDFALFKAQTGTNKSDSSGETHHYDRIYKYSVKDLTTGEYVAYMIPCKNANNEAGFYDAIRQNFYTAYGGASNLTALND